MSQDIQTQNVRTSDTHPLQIAQWQIADTTFGLSARPGRWGPSMSGDVWARDLDTDISVVRAWEPSHVIVVTTRETEEINALRVALHSIPGLVIDTLFIAPFQVPDDTQLRMIDALSATNPARVLILSERGMERGGVVMARMMRTLGVPAARMQRLINDVRPDVISTEIQKEMIERTPHA